MSATADNFVGTLAEARRYIKLICDENGQLDREVVKWHDEAHPRRHGTCVECDRRVRINAPAAPL